MEHMLADELDTCSLHQPSQTDRSQQAGPFPSCLKVVGWTALLGLTVFRLFPQLEAVANIAGGLGALVLVGVWWVRCPGSEGEEPVMRLLKWALIIFLGVALGSTVIPNLSYLPAREPMIDSFHELWNLVQSVVAALLCITLVRTKRDLLSLLAFLALVAIVMSTATVLEYVFKATATYRRMTGTKGGPNRFSILLLLSMLLVCALERTRILLRVSLPDWAARFGWILAVVAPLLLYRKVISRLHKSEFLQLSHTDTRSVVMLMLISLAVGLAAWFLCQRQSGLRCVLLLVGLVLILVSMFVAGSRTVLVLGAGLVGIVVLLWTRRRTMVLLVTFLLAAGLLAGLKAKRPNALTKEALLRDSSVRLEIFRAALHHVKERPLLGIGYGRKAFEREWPFNPPYPFKLDASVDIHAWRPDHAHSLWGQLLSTQGSLGWLAFHVLWGCVVCALIRGLKRPAVDQNGSGMEKEGWLSSELVSQGYRPLMAISLLGLVLLQINGILMLPLQECNETIYWLVGALGIVALRLEVSRVRAEDPCP